MNIKTVVPKNPKPIKAIQWDGKNIKEVNDLVGLNAIVGYGNNELFIERVGENSLHVPIDFFLVSDWKGTIPWFRSLSPEEYAERYEAVNTGDKFIRLAELEIFLDAMWKKYPDGTAREALSELTNCVDIFRTITPFTEGIK